MKTEVPLFVCGCIVRAMGDGLGAMGKAQQRVFSGIKGIQGIYSRNGDWAIRRYGVKSSVRRQKTEVSNTKMVR